MRIAKIHGIRDMQLHEVDSPIASDGEVLVRILSVGLCGSDLHYYLEGGIGTARIEAPMTTGHEVAAEVIEGTGAPYGISDGTLFAIDPAQPCGDCEHCHAGYANLCPHIRFLGTPTVAGALCETMAVPVRNLVLLPEGFDADQGALLEPLGVALHAVDITRIKPMSGVAVVGAGPIGLLVTQVARVAGAAHVRVIEPHAGRREAALRLGADAVHANWDDALRATDGRGEDYVIEATNSPEGPEHASRIAAIGGRVTIVGIPEGDEITLQSGSARRKGLTIKFSRRMGHVYPRAVELVRQRRVDLTSLITHRYPLQEVVEAYETASALPPTFIKAMISPCAEGV